MKVRYVGRCNVCLRAGRHVVAQSRIVSFHLCHSLHSLYSSSAEEE